jgi:hypothetical protein
MKTKLLTICLLLLSSQVFSWTNNDRNIFKKNCMKTAIESVGSHAVAKSYCDCALKKFSSNFTVKELNKLGASGIKTNAISLRIIQDCANKSIK